MDDRYPIPRLREILDAATGFKFYSSLDLEASFHQLQLEDSSSSITAFTWKNIHYRFIGAHFGLKTLTAIFQRITSQLLYDLPNVFAFVDDILIVSSSFEDHLSLVKLVLSRLSASKLTINLKKCKFLLKQVHVLGHILSENGIKIDIGELEKVHN